jgi:uncharacterized protein (DUF1800 family)
MRKATILVLQRGLVLAVTVAAITLAQAQQATLPSLRIILMDGDLHEAWPDPGMVAVRRDSDVGALDVSLILKGTALSGVDYTPSATATLNIPAGEREAWISFLPLVDALKEKTEDIIVELVPAATYTIPTNKKEQSVTLKLANAEPGKPGAKEAIRFLNQAAFGASSDSAADADIVSESAETVMSLGFEAWIESQFKKPLSLHQPFVNYKLARPRAKNDYSDPKLESWWRKVMGVGSAYPGAPAVAADPLRQRVAFALSELFVVSQNLDELGNEPKGLTNYYDMLVRGSFGNFRDLLYNVSTHPCMGVYLSHLKNRKADPVAGTFPDENYAREIMQLFSIGLWELNADGSRKLDASNQPIPTYDNEDITNFARVFTGLSFGGKKANNFWYIEDRATNEKRYQTPMKMWDEYHDMEPKTLLNGITLPARTASNPETGAAGLLDLNAAIDCLFNHSNVGPFIGKQLIQRLVTSNPSADYISRISAKFADNGVGVRGDMKAVIKAILLDPEARSYAMQSSERYGKLKEPYLQTVHFARAFNAKSTGGTYRMDGYWSGYRVHFQTPYASPSVFNFFRPGYSPPGILSDASPTILAPEFQILNTISAILMPNYYYNVVRAPGDGFNYSETSTHRVVAQTGIERAMYKDVPALVRRLDMLLTGGMLSPESNQIIREAVEGITTNMWMWEKERVYAAIYLILTSPEFSIQR